MKKTLLAWAAFGVVASAAAQIDNARADFEKINQAYAQLAGLQTVMDYVYYPSHDATTPGETMQATLSKQGTALHFQLGEMENLSTDDITLLIDHEEKKIFIDHVPKDVQQTLFGADISAVLSVCSAVRMSQPEPNIRKYELVADLSETERIDIYFDTRTYLMQRVVLYYNYVLTKDYGGTGEKPRLELVYRRQDTQPHFAPNLFSPDRFVKKSGEAWVAVAPFKSYKVVSALK